MASILDFLQPRGGTPLGFTLGGIAQERSGALEDTGLSKVQNTRQYKRGAQDLVSRFSDRGLGYGGHAKNQAAGRMTEDYQWAQDDADRLLRRTMGQLDRQRLLATLGVSV